MTDVKATKSCFVISRIGEPDTETRKRSDQILKHVIKPAVESLGYHAIRADEIDKPGLITSQVISHVVDDDLVVADLTERNPNVFYELAIRHALNKPLVQLIAKHERIPFDVAGTRTIHVDHTDLDSAARARNEIVAQVKSLEENPADTDTPISVAVDLQRLRKSDNPEQRSLADIMSVVSEIRGAVSKLENNTALLERLVAIESLLGVLTRRVTVGQRALDIRRLGGRFSARLVHSAFLSAGARLEATPEIVLAAFSLIRDAVPSTFELARMLFEAEVRGDEKLKRVCAERLLSLMGSDEFPGQTMESPELRRTLGEIRYSIHDLLDDYLHNAGHTGDANSPEEGGAHAIRRGVARRPSVDNS